MIKTEAAWIREILLRLQPELILNLGSSTRYFREVEQPWISEALEGFRVLHVDKKVESGVDIFYDVCNPKFGISAPCDIVLMSSLLEHVGDRDRAMHNATAPSARYLIVTVPANWPHHPDPIDNGYRPQPDELARYVESFGYTVLERKLLTDPRGECSAVLAERNE